MPQRDQTTGKILPSGRLWDFTERIAKSRREGLVGLFLSPALSFLSPLPFLLLLPTSTSLSFSYYSFLASCGLASLSDFSARITSIHTFSLSLFTYLTSHSKNRRDGATVSTRVLALADQIGGALYRDAAAAAAEGEAVVVDEGAVARRRRRKARL